MLQSFALSACLELNVHCDYQDIAVRSPTLELSFYPLHVAKEIRTLHFDQITQAGLKARQYCFIDRLILTSARMSQIWESAHSKWANGSTVWIA